MAEVATAVVSLMPSFRGGARAISSELGGPLDRAGRDGGRRFGGGMRAGIAGIATRVFAPLAAAAGGVALAGFFKSAIDAAGDLEQSVGAVDSVFRDQAGVIHDYAAEAASAVGLSANAYSQSASVVGAMLTNYGVAADEVASSTNSLIGYASDLSAMFGGTTQEAVDALAAALRGEADPAERFGLSLNKTAVSAHMAATGIDNQAEATLDLIKQQMEASGAMGQFAREGDTLQGAQQRLAAGWADIKASIGNLFLPAAAAATGFLADMLPHIQGVVDKLQEFRDAIAGSDFMTAISKAFDSGDGLFDGLLSAAQVGFQRLLDWLTTGGLTSILNGILSGRQALFDAALQLFPQILNAAMEIIPQIVTWLAGTAIPQLINVVVTTIPMLAQLLATVVPQLITTLLSLLPTLLQAGVQLFMSLLQALVQVLPQLVTTLVTFLPQLLTTVLGMLPQLLQTGIELFMSLLTAVLEVLPQLIELLLGTLLPQLLTTVLGMLPDLLETGIELFMSLLDAVMEILPQLIELLIGTVLPQLVTTLIGMIPQLLETAIKIFTALLDGLIEVLPKIVSWISGTLIPTLITAILGAVSQMLSAGKDVLGGFWDGVKDKFVAVDGWFRELPSRILSAIGSLASTLLDAGRSVIQGFLDGIYEKFNAVRSALSSLTDLLPDWKGPAERDATILYDAGQLVMGGFIGGLESQYANVRRTLQGLTHGVPGAVSVTGSVSSAAADAPAPVHLSADSIGALAAAILAGARRVSQGAVDDFALAQSRGVA